MFQDAGSAHGTGATTSALPTAADYLLARNELIQVTVPLTRLTERNKDFFSFLFAVIRTSVQHQSLLLKVQMTESTEQLEAGARRALFK